MLQLIHTRICKWRACPSRQRDLCTSRSCAVLRNDVESLEETLRVLSDPDLLTQVHASRAESDVAVTVDRNEALAMLGTGA